MTDALLPPRVLLITPNPVLQQTLQPLLEQQDLRVAVCPDAATAASMWSEHLPEKVWCDADVAPADVDTVLACAQRHPAGTPQRPATVVLVHDHALDDPMAWVDKGVSDFLALPLDAALFEARLAAWLRARNTLAQACDAAALQDATTGWPNRTAGLGWLNKALAGAHRSGLPLSVVLWAVPPAGVAPAVPFLTSPTRGEDLWIRWSADRLLLVAARASLMDTVRLTERHIKTWPGATEGVAAAVAAVSSSTPDATTLMAQAEAALALALQTGDLAVAMHSGGGPRVAAAPKRF